MRTVAKTLVIALGMALLAACGGGGGGMSKVVDHMEKVAGILEANKADGDKAAAEVEAYMKEHKAEVDKIMADMQAKAEGMKDKVAEIMKDVKDPAEAQEKMKEIMADMGLDEATMKRAEEVDQKIKTLMKENPSLAENEKLENLLDEMSPKGGMM